MQLFNFRAGLATNSSSSHSLIFWAGQKDYHADGDFGWSNFILASPEMKTLYAALLLQYSLQNKGINEDVRNTLVQAWAGVLPGDGDYIDHQSIYYLPYSYGTNIVDRQFFDDLKAFLLRDNLVILGGNDNSDRDWKPDGDFELPIGTESLPGVCRKDGNYWTVFNPHDGTKIRFSFDDLTSVPTRASAPELVDVKITDFCPYDCPFCYQGSTGNGKHAPMGYIKSLIRVLSDMKVFEIAIGGGEPTLHPDFVNILRTAKDAGITPNFTTRNLTWLSDLKRRDSILSYAGAFAYSASNANDIHHLANLLDATSENMYPEHSRANVHIVMGTNNEPNFRSMLKVAHDRSLRVTLLGYKPLLRGNTYVAQDYRWWIKAVEELTNKYECPTLSIDTVLASQFEEQLKTWGVPKWLYHTKDGLFSAYVDAVAGSIGPSSYEPDRMVELPLTGREDEGIFKGIYQTW